MTALVRLAPGARHQPSGYVHGVVVPPGLHTLHVAGQLGAGRDNQIASSDFAIQFGVALDNVLAVVKEAGGEAGSISKLTAYITDFDEYRAAQNTLAVLWRSRFGDLNTAMTIVQVAGLINPMAKVELEAVAHVSPQEP